MRTLQRVIIGDSRDMGQVGDATIDLVVTSPPYPMIEMWDEVFASLSPDCSQALADGDGNRAFEAMHRELDSVWREVARVLKPGAFACINVGDATRTVAGRFRLYSNHSRITDTFRRFGFDCLPVVLWRKQTNAPNKFMGSGMLPAGAYVTLEHEFILIFRKSGKREFSAASEKQARMRSAFFWEERNRWFSDVWDFKGASQNLNHNDLRKRSGAFRLELPYRLINMYSLYEDTVLDPFLGTGTTSFAALACGRNSIGIEIDKAFPPVILDQAPSFLATATGILSARITDHMQFVSSQSALKGPLKYRNEPHGFPVVTRQETGLQLYSVTDLKVLPDLTVESLYRPVGRCEDGTAAEVRVEELQQGLLPSL